MFVITAYEGQEIRVGDRLLTVGTFRAPGMVDVAVDGEEAPVTVLSDRKLELFPDVFLSMERNQNMSNRVKFLFDAPRAVRIRELPYDPSP